MIDAMRVFVTWVGTLGPWPLAVGFMVVQWLLILGLFRGLRAASRGVKEGAEGLERFGLSWAEQITRLRQEISYARRLAIGSPEQFEVAVRRLPMAEGLPLPAHQTDGAAGLDLLAACGAVIGPYSQGTVATGLCFAIPAGYEGQVRSRSGLARKNGVVVLNAPGTIDSDFTGEIQVVLYNTSKAPFLVKRGDRIAQLAICPVRQVKLVEVDRLDETARGEGGFGSTGVALVPHVDGLYERLQGFTGAE